MTPVEEQLFNRFPQPLLLIENNVVVQANSAYLAEFETAMPCNISVQELFPVLDRSSAYTIKETRMPTPSGISYSV